MTIKAKTALKINKRKNVKLVQAKKKRSLHDFCCANLKILKTIVNLHPFSASSNNSLHIKIKRRKAEKQTEKRQQKPSRLIKNF